MDCKAIMELAKTEIRKEFDNQESNFKDLTFSRWVELEYSINSPCNTIYKPGVYLYKYYKSGFDKKMLTDNKPWLYADYIGMSTFKISARRHQFITVIEGKNIFENSRQDHIGAEKAKRMWDNLKKEDFCYCIANCPSSYTHEVEQILLDDYVKHHKKLPILQGQWSKKYDM